MAIKSKSNNIPTMLADPAAYDLIINWLKDPLMDTAGRATKLAILEYIRYLEKKVNDVNGRKS